MCIICCLSTTLVTCSMFIAACDRLEAIFSAIAMQFQHTFGEFGERLLSILFVRGRNSSCRAVARWKRTITFTFLPRAKCKMNQAGAIYLIISVHIYRLKYNGMYFDSEIAGMSSAESITSKEKNAPRKIYLTNNLTTLIAFYTYREITKNHLQSFNLKSKKQQQSSRRD